MRYHLVPTGLFIDNNFVPAAGNATLTTDNPATGAQLAIVSAAQKEDIDRAVESSKRAFANWKAELPATRRKLLCRLADLVERDAADLATLEALDAGILYRDSTGLHIPQSLENLRYFAGWADKVDGLSLTIPDGLAYTRREPIGVCAAIVPWNAPLYVHRACTTLYYTTDTCLKKDDNRVEACTCPCCRQHSHYQDA